MRAVAKKKQVHREKAGLLHLLSGSCKYLGKRDREYESYLYPVTSLLLWNRPAARDLERGFQEAGGLLKIRQAIRGLDPTLYLAHKYFLKLLTNGVGRGFGLEQGLVGEHRGC